MHKFNFLQFLNLINFCFPHNFHIFISPTLNLYGSYFFVLSKLFCLFNATIFTLATIHAIPLSASQFICEIATIIIKFYVSNNLTPQTISSLYHFRWEIEKFLAACLRFQRIDETEKSLSQFKLLCFFAISEQNALFFRMHASTMFWVNVLPVFSDNMNVQLSYFFDVFKVLLFSEFHSEVANVF